MPGSRNADRVKPMSPTSMHGHTPQPEAPQQFNDATLAAPLGFPSSFRNVSACYRCRARKHRCDQRLPRCGPCEKSQIRCVGYDPITKEEIPRSYVYFLENRVRFLSTLLVHHNIDFKPATAFEEDGATDQDMAGTDIPKDDSPKMNDFDFQKKAQGLPSSLCDESLSGGTALESPVSMVHMDDPVLDLLVGKAAKRAVMESDSSEKSRGTSIRHSFFGLRSEALPEECVALPSRDDADILVGLYFAHTNFHLPVLHYDEFQEILDHTYGAAPSDRSSYHLYTLFVVFAIGAAAGSDARKKDMDHEQPTYRHAMGPQKRRRISKDCAAPEEYHASAMAYLAQSLVCLSSSDDLDNLRELQAIILLAGFALLRPTSPGLGKLVDVAMSSAIDLKMYCEQDSNEFDLDREMDGIEAHPEWMTDWRRRLWWCVYSLERLVAPYLGRPFAIPDDVITTDFPSTLEDRFITRHGLVRPPVVKATYKHTAQHYFKLRILQSEIYSVIQYQKARLGRKKDGRHQPPSIFLESYPSFSQWRKDISYRLDEWKASIPVRGTPGVWSCVLPMELDYWKAVVMLYRWSVRIPSEFISERGAFDGILHGFAITVPAETDLICIKAVEACQKVLHIYRGLQNMGMISAIRIAIQDVFTAGSILLFAIWNSSLVRRNLALPSIDYAILAATTVMDTISDKDFSTRTFRAALQRMSTTTMQMCMSKTNIEHTFPRTTGSKVPVTPRSLLKRHRDEITTSSTSKRRSRIAQVHPYTAQPDLQTEAMPLRTGDCENSFLGLNLILDCNKSTRSYEDPSLWSFPFENFIEEPIVKSPSNQQDNRDALSLASVPSITPFAHIFHTREALADDDLVLRSPELVDFGSQIPGGTSSPPQDLEDFVPRYLPADGEAKGPSNLENEQDVLDAFLVGWADPCSPISC